MTKINPNLPLIDDVYAKRVFDALTYMEVELDADPLIYGPKRLNGKIAQARTHLSRCSQFHQQVSQDLHMLSRAHRQAKLDFDIQMQEMFANDPDVRSAKHIRDREAIATMKLRDERDTITQLESSILDLKSVMLVVKAKSEDIKDIQGRLKDQLNLCKEETNLGARWGSQPGPGASRGPDLSAAPRVDTHALEQMNDLVGDVEGETSISDLERFVAMETTHHPREPEPVEPMAVGVEDAFVSVPDVVDMSFLDDEADVGASVPAGSTVTDDDEDDSVEDPEPHPDR